MQHFIHKVVVPTDFICWKKTVLGLRFVKFVSSVFLLFVLH